MTRITYIEKRFTPESYALIDQANAIIAEYDAQGYSLTLRQLYYQLVARDVIPNNLRSYKNLGNKINDARLAGLIDWEAIEDRTRNLRGRPHWRSPGDIVRSAAYGYHVDHWRGQDYRVEVWIEKEALAQIAEQACNPLDVSYFSCRGYPSASEVWRAAQRFQKYLEDGQEPVIIHLGDHDPSGIDMTRDLIERVRLLTGHEVEVNRIALNIDQVRRFRPPPNPAKLTDSRIGGYVKVHGRQSWELDALSPSVLVNLIEATIGEYMNRDLFDERAGVARRGRMELDKIARHWGEVVRFLEHEE